MKNKYDVIVVGAGIGGLSAAAILARNGKKVLVLEKNPVAGGYAVNFRRGKFQFDASLHLVCGCNDGGPTYKMLEEAGVIGKVSFAKPKYLYRSIFPGLDLRIIQNDPQAYLDDLINRFPQEEKGIRELSEEIGKIYDQMLQYMSYPIPFSIERLYFRLKYPMLFYYSTKPFQVMLDRFLKNSSLKAIVSQLWEYLGLPPSRLSCLNFAYAWHDYLYNGGYYPVGGSQALSEALVEVVQENNGQVLLSSEVEKIIIKNKTAQGVWTKNKGDFFGDKIILGIDAKTAFFRLIGEENIPQKYKTQLLSLQPSISAFQVYLGLNTDMKSLDVSDYEIFDNPDYDLDKQFLAIEENDMEKVSCVITLYSNLLSDTGHTGNSIAGIISLAGYNFWKKFSDKKTYTETKKRMANILIKRAEKIIPGFSSYIETIEIATPLTMEKYTGNYQGAIYGWSQINSQSGLSRLSAKTPIKNIYLASAWTHPGGGVTGVLFAGKQIADRILRAR